jgi:hypothetical protein
MKARPDPDEGWTPGIVKVRLIAALQWAHYSAGRVGPAPMGSGMPVFRATFDDHMAEGWGIPEIADPDDVVEKVVRIAATPAEVEAHLEALGWVADYLLPAHPNLASILSLWLRCKVQRHSFDKAIDRRRNLARGHAYRLRDRALSLISQALANAGSPIDGSSVRGVKWKD